MTKEAREVIANSREAGLKEYTSGKMHLSIERDGSNNDYTILLNGVDISKHVMRIVFGQGGRIDGRSRPSVSIEVLYDSVELIGWSGAILTVKPRSLG